MRDLFIGKRFMILGLALVTLFVVSFVWEFLFFLSLWVFLGALGLLAFEIFSLYGYPHFVKIVRKTAERWDLGDENSVTYEFYHSFSKNTEVEFSDDIPYQLQLRKEEITCTLVKDEKVIIVNAFTPTLRGEYRFGNARVFMHGPLGLFKRRFMSEIPETIAVYPSVLQMRKFELAAQAMNHQSLGIKKMRRIGHSYEFEQIRNYQSGDEFRSINWKATGRAGKLQVNQYQDERSQPIYTLIDKSRNMRLPFNGLTLLDYAINTGLVLANLNLVKGDKAGLITFAQKVETTLVADKKSTQLKRILEALYKEEERLEEANYEGLYTYLNRRLTQRSILFLFTNIETEFALDRVLPLWRSINKRHVLIVIFFQNTELTQYGKSTVEETSDVFLHHSANQLVAEKEYLINQVQAAGIMTLHTKPEDLIVNTVNKYLELKARGLA
ncbi:MAG: DUF58 domain-containing protein [Schleiferiaceae bacterium]